MLCIQVSQLSHWMAGQFVLTACLHIPHGYLIHGPGLVSTSRPRRIKRRRLTVCRGLGLQVQACENLGFDLINCTCVSET